MSLLEESILEAPIIKRGKYSYIVHPLTDGIPKIEPKLLEEVVNRIKKHLDRFGEIDRIVTVEAMGIPLATLLSTKTGIPFTIVRKREYGLPYEISVEQVTGYSKSKLFINGIYNGDRVIIVDDVLSTGGTLRAVLRSLIDRKVVVKAVIVAIDKGNSRFSIEKEFGVPIIAIAEIEVNNEVKVRNIN